ncbi:hypothetical protein V6N11_083149 [Hibiscus sabdariffa]|uniref:Uncharacterized protein n=1 Tax=Hibiscus sabdariffa TaxID=183260 RepID=A0ABR2QL59_9ROSI
MVEKLGLEGPFDLYWRVSGAALSKASVRPLRSDFDYDEEVVVEEEVGVEEEIGVEVKAEVEEEDEEGNREEFEDNDTKFRVDEKEQQENIGIGIKVERQMDGFGDDGVRVNPEIESNNDKSDELHSNHDSDGLRSIALALLSNSSGQLILN